MKRLQSLHEGRSLRENVLNDIRSLADHAPAGTKLPTIRRLMADFSVSQHVVQAGLNQLRAEGLIVSQVGRGTFVAERNIVSRRPRKVLTLLYQHPYERGDIIARLIHQRLCIEGHESLVLTYSNTQHVTEMLKNGSEFDTCILQPRSSVVPVSLLALLKQRAEHVLIESLAAEHFDVDAVSNDPRVCVELAVRHLWDQGYEAVIWVTESGQNYFFARAAEIFSAFCGGFGGARSGCSVVRADPAPDRLGIGDLSGAFAHLGLKHSRRRVAVVVASFVDGQTILDAMESCGLRTPEDVGVVRIGTPDLEADHARRITTVGRRSTQAAATVLDRVAWRWKNPNLPWMTFYDTPIIQVFDSTQPSESALAKAVPSQNGLAALTSTHRVVRTKC